MQTLKEYREKLKQKAIDLRGYDLSYREIGKQVGMSYQWVWKVINSSQVKKVDSKIVKE